MPSGFNGVGLEDNGHSERKGTALTASFHILTSVIGYGILSLPRANAQLGWITGPAFTLLFAFVAYHTSTLLSACYRSGNEHSGQRTSTYIDVAGSNLGGTKYKIFLGVHNIYLFGVGVVYTTASSAIMKQILSSTHCSDNGSEKNPCHVKLNQQMIVFGVIQFIYSQIPDSDLLGILIIINVITTFIYSNIGVGLSIARVAETGKFKGSLSGFRTGKVTAIEKIWRTFQALGEIAFAYIFSNILIEIQDTLKSPPSEAETTKKACLIGLGVTTLLYMLCGCFGYAAFGDLAAENFLDGFLRPHWLLEIANAAIVRHLICSYQAYCQPLFAFVEKTVAQTFPDSQFINRNFDVPMPGSRTYKVNFFRLVWRTMFVIITTVVAMRLKFFKEAVSLVGALGFFPLTVYFPVEIYIAQKQIPKWSSEWIWLQMLSFVCLIVTIAAVVGSIAGIVLDF